MANDNAVDSYAELDERGLGSQPWRWVRSTTGLSGEAAGAIKWGNGRPALPNGANAGATGRDYGRSNPDVDGVARLGRAALNGALAQTPHYSCVEDMICSFVAKAKRLS